MANASGLGRANFASPAAISQYLTSIRVSDFLTDLVRSLPRAGHDGTHR
ncbi:MAG: D-alanyl-D-alanine carboxypeptidase [Brevibacterium sp.]